MKPWKLRLINRKNNLRYPKTYSIFTYARQLAGQLKNQNKLKNMKKLILTHHYTNRCTIDIDPMLALIEEEGDLCHADYYRCQYAREWRKARRLNRLNTWRDDTGIEYVEVGRQQ